MSALLLLPAGVLASAEDWLPGGALLVRGGRVAALFASHAEARRAGAGARVRALPDLVATAGLVNAHAHLELTGLAGALPRGGDFGAWVGRLLALRAARGSEQLARDALAGAQRCLATGTTCVGDVDTTGAGARGLRAAPLRVVSFRELLDAQDPARTAAAAQRLAAPLARGARFREGLAPHAPFSASPALLAAIGRRAGARTPLSSHWAETAAELRWLADGSGPLAELVGPSPRRAGLDLLAEAGLLRGPLALVHGNHPAAGEPERIAAAGAALVHCPGSHAFFEREPFPLAAYLRAGVPVALGTDSRASNDDLDLLREVRLARERFPELAPARAWDMATRDGALALGMEREVGSLLPGRRADVALWQLDGLPAGAGPTALLEALTRGGARCAGAWIGGRPRASASAFGAAAPGGTPAAKDGEGPLR